MSSDRPPDGDAAAHETGPPATPPAAGPAAPVTLEFGEEPRRRPGLHAPAWLRADPRLVPVAAGLGAVALLFSVLSEWQTTAITGGLFGGDDEVEPRTISTGVGDLGGWTGGYLAGVFLLVAAVTLVVFGPRAGRAYARLTALSTAAALAVLLVVLSGPLADSSFALPAFLTYDVPDGRYEVARGRGVWCALAGVLLAAAAAWLATAPAAPAPGTAPAPAPTAAPPADEHPADWPWRRAAAAPGDDEDDDLPPPTDLTVGRAAPFTPLPGDRDTTDGGWRGTGR